MMTNLAMTLDSFLKSETATLQSYFSDDMCSQTQIENSPDAFSRSWGSHWSKDHWKRAKIGREMATRDVSNAILKFRILQTAWRAPVRAPGVVATPCPSVSHAHQNFSPTIILTELGACHNRAALWQQLSQHAALLQVCLGVSWLNLVLVIVWLAPTCSSGGVFPQWNNPNCVAKQHDLFHPCGSHAGKLQGNESIQVNFQVMKLMSRSWNCLSKWFSRR